MNRSLSASALPLPVMPLAFLLFLSAICLVPMHLHAESGVSPEVKSKVDNDHKAMASDYLKRQEGNTSPIDDPSNVVNTQNVSQMLQNISNATTFIQQPLQAAEGFASGLLSGLSGIMNKLGGFAVGPGSMFPGGKPQGSPSSNGGGVCPAGNIPCNTQDYENDQKPVGDQTNKGKPPTAAPCSGRYGCGESGGARTQGGTRNQ